MVHILLTYNACDTNVLHIRTYQGCINAPCKTIGLHSDRCQHITELLSLSIPMPLFSTIVLNLLLLVVRFMHQAAPSLLLKLVSVCLPYRNYSYLRMSPLPLLGMLYELSDRSVSRPSPPCNNRDTALPGSF